MDLSNIKTPCYIIDEDKIEENCKILAKVMDNTGCRILLAQKAYSCYGTYETIAKYLSGTTASGLNEARLGKEEMGIPYNKETHVFNPAYKEDEIDEIIELCDYMVFNNLRQWKKYKDRIVDARKSGKVIHCGIRVNPEYSEIDTAIYNPCFAGSRLGCTVGEFERTIKHDPDILDGIDGLHFHTMCEQNSDVLERTLPYVEDKFGKYLENMSWINLGGGHHITRSDYDIEKLEKCITHIKDKYKLTVYLEPGEAVALNAGVLVSTVLDTGYNEINYAILDTSAECHMPDVIEMPYRPEVVGAAMPNVKDFTYRLGGPTCLAGDIIGDYSFDESLVPGQQLVFKDMAIYSMVKNNTFNGMNLPDILIYSKKNGIKEYKTFGYEDFKERV